MFDSPELTYATYKQLEWERARAIGGRPGPRTQEQKGLGPRERTHKWASEGWGAMGRAAEKSTRGTNGLMILVMALAGVDGDFDS